MSPLAIAVLSLSLSADAFAAAVGRGAAKRPTKAQAFRAAIAFGAAEGLAACLGWGLGRWASPLVAAVDHWVAFTLLVLVGGRMIIEAFRAKTNAADEPRPSRSRGWSLIFTAMGSSIDTVAASAGLALAGGDMLALCLCVAATSFCLGGLGMLAGAAAGRKLGVWAELAGGVGLIALGAFILSQHLSGG